jgi:hypothetical protein
MIAHHLTRTEWRRPPAPNGAGLSRLGWPHFWLLGAILGGMLGLVAMIFIGYFVTF